MIKKANDKDNLCGGLKMPKILPPKPSKSKPTKTSDTKTPKKKK